MVSQCKDKRELDARFYIVTLKLRIGRNNCIEVVKFKYFYYH